MVSSYCQRGMNLNSCDFSVSGAGLCRVNGGGGGGVYHHQSVLGSTWSIHGNAGLVVQHFSKNCR